MSSTKRVKGRGRMEGDIDRFRSQHMTLTSRDVATAAGMVSVLVNDSESPLAWLARRRARDGRPMIGPHQLVAGERLHADFTRGHLSPRVTSDWSSISSRRGGGGNTGEMTDVVVAARQRVRGALDACGPEFSGLLLDICCFTRGLEDIERERGWPARSGKVVLQLALDRLARHYGLAHEASGPEQARFRTWVAE